MSIKFKLSRWDLFLATLIMYIQQPLNIIFNGLVILLGCFALWIITSSLESLLSRILILIIACAVIIFLTIGFIVLYILFIAFSKNNENLLAEQNWIINDELLTYETELSRSEIKWKALKKIIPVGSYCFLYLSQMGACIIPKRAFDSDQEWKEFISFCRSKLKK